MKSSLKKKVYFIGPRHWSIPKVPFEFRSLGVQNYNPIVQQAIQRIQ